MKSNISVFTFLIALAPMLSITAQTANSDDVDGTAAASPRNKVFTGINRTDTNGKTLLVLQNKDHDFLTVPDTPPAMAPKLEDAFASDNQIAVVMDYDFMLHYDLLKFEDGDWKVVNEANFFPLNIGSRDKLIAVKVVDLTHAELAFRPPGVPGFRPKGIVKSGDIKLSYEFLQNGKVKENGQPSVYSTVEDLEQ